MQLFCVFSTVVPHLTIGCDFSCCQFPIQLNDKPFFPPYSNEGGVSKQCAGTKDILLEFKGLLFKKDLPLSPENYFPLDALNHFCSLRKKAKQCVCRICEHLWLYASSSSCLIVNRVFESWFQLDNTQSGISNR